MDPPGQLSGVHTAGSVSCCRYHGVRHLCSDSQLTAGQPDCCTSQLESKSIPADGRACGGGVAFRRSTTPDCEIILETAGSSPRKGGLIERDVAADVPCSVGGGVVGDGDVSYSLRLPWHGAHFENVLDGPQLCRSTMTSPIVRRRTIFPEADINAYVVGESDGGAAHSCPLLRRNQRANRSRDHRAPACRDDVQATPTAPPTPVAATETAALKPLDGHSTDFVSRAAAEAWAAAETWAWTMAAATGAAATGGRQVSAKTKIVGVEIKAATLGATESGLRRDVSNAEGRYDKGCGCSVSSKSVAGGICRSDVHKLDSVLYSSPIPQGGHGTLRHFVDRAPSKLPQRNLTGNSSKGILRTRRREDSFEADARAWQGTVVLDPLVPVGAAAAIVLGRIERGEQAWRRRAQRMGLVSFRAHRLWVGRRRKLHAMAMNHCEIVRMGQFLRSLKARIRRKDNPEKTAAAALAAAAAAAAASTADKVFWARRMRRVIFTLRR